MKLIAIIVGLACFLTLAGCEQPKETSAPVTPPAEPAIAGQAAEPAPPVMVVSQEVVQAAAVVSQETVKAAEAAVEQPAGPAAGAEAATNGTEVAEAKAAAAVEQAGGAAPTNEQQAVKAAEPAGAAKPAGPAPVFSLADAALDPAVLTRQNIAVTDKEPRVLTFTPASVPLALSVDGLPVGDAPRTIIAAVKTLRIARDVTPVMYGRTDERQLCAFSINHRMQYSFWGFGADLSSEHEGSDDWVVLAFVYNGTTGKLYVNGSMANMAPMALKTEATPLVLGGRGFVGKVAGVRVFSEALSDEQIATMSAEQLAALASEK